MTDVTENRGQAEAELSAADEQVLRELTERARTGGLRLAGEGGLLGKLTKMVIEGALEGELDDHLGYGKHDPEGRDGGNSRNGHRAKTVITETGPVELSVPRDRDSSFEPKIVAKRQRRLTGVDEMVISLSAKGLTHGEIAAHLAEVYGAEVSKQTITTITDRVMEGLAEWQSRPQGWGQSKCFGLQVACCDPVSFPGGWLQAEEGQCLESGAVPAEVAAGRGVVGVAGAVEHADGGIGD